MLMPIWVVVIVVISFLLGVLLEKLVAWTKRVRENEHE